MWNSKEQVRKAAEGLIGRTIGDILSSQINVRNKGHIGTLIEKEYFNLTIGNAAKPDFANLGMELKVVPAIKRKSDGKFKAKERVSLSMINYNEIINETFDTSKFKFKNEWIQFIWYHHDISKPRAEWVVIGAKQFNICDLHDGLAEHDWKSIQKKVMDGYAHELSEGDTKYIGAVTKGRDSKDVRTQPNSDSMAKRRGFSIKNRYATKLLDDAIRAYHEDNDLVSIKEYVQNKLNKLIGKNMNELGNILGVSKISKNKMSDIVKKYLDLNKFDKDQLKLSNTIVKVRLNKDNGKAQEHMRMGRVLLDDLENDDWEDSQIRADLEDLKIIDVRYNSRNAITSVKVVEIKDSDLEKIREEYYDIQDVLKNNFEVVKVKNRKTNNLPKGKNTEFIHLRPGAKDGNDTYNFKGFDITKQVWWLNKEFLD